MNAVELPVASRSKIEGDPSGARPCQGQAKEPTIPGMKN